MQISIAADLDGVLHLRKKKVTNICAIPSDSPRLTRKLSVQSTGQGGCGRQKTRD
jgi:hypothetical protein